MATTPTYDTYTELDRAYDSFNAALFGGHLPSCVITMQRRRKAYGYFAGNSWTDAAGRLVTDEIAMSPDKFAVRSTAETLSTLVHEMCHLWQHHFGTPSRGRYHNREWGRMMEAVGLIPSDTGEPGGKKTGDRMSHYIEPGGRFEQACAALLAEGFTVPWVARADAGEDPARKKKRLASKTKYACPSCGLSVWGKPEIKVACVECREALQADIPEEEEGGQDSHAA
jgi:predicted SprT family Zn-dependent metalloprotease